MRCVYEGAANTSASARAPGESLPTSARRSARAPPTVAAHSASSAVIPSSRTPSAMQKLIEVVLLEPGLQLVASATVAPASINRRAFGYGWRVEKSVAGSSVATVLDPASASTSPSDRWVQ